MTCPSEQERRGDALLMLAAAQSLVRGNVSVALKPEQVACLMEVCEEEHERE